MSTRLIDLRKSTNHPASIKYSEIFDAGVLDGLIIHGRSQPGFALNGISPFVLSAKEAIKYGIKKEGVISILEESFKKYYDCIQAKSATEWFGIESDSNKQLKETPPWGAVFPWRARSIESYRGMFEKAAIEENASVGKEGGIEKGWLFNGPVEDFKIRIEAERMLYVLTRISEEGYKRHDGDDGDPRATALIDENFNWRWLLTGGNHRASAAAALGFNSIPIRINLIINRTEVEYWPHVVNGTFTIEQALRIFDSYFNAEPRVDIRKWKQINIK